MKFEIYDFRKPGRLTSDVEHRVVSWLRSAISLLPAKWTKHLNIPIEMSLNGVHTANASEALYLLPDAIVCHCVTLGNASVDSLIAFPRNLSLALLAGVMGDSPTEFPADRVLTPVEESLWSFLLQQIIHVVQETWPGNEPLALRVGSPVEQAKRSRLLSSD